MRSCVYILLKMLSSQQSANAAALHRHFHPHSMQATRSRRFLCCLQAFVEKLHHSKQHFVLIVDPGIKIDPGYPAYDRGLKGKVFINDLTGEPYVGQVTAAFVIWCCVIAVAVLERACEWLGMLLMPVLLSGRRLRSCRLCTCMSLCADHAEPAFLSACCHSFAGQTPLTGLLLQV